MSTSDLFEKWARSVKPAPQGKELETLRSAWTDGCQVGLGRAVFRLHAERKKLKDELDRLDPAPQSIDRADLEAQIKFVGRVMVAVAELDPTLPVPQEEVTAFSPPTPDPGPWTVWTQEKGKSLVERRDTYDTFEVACDFANELVGYHKHAAGVVKNGAGKIVHHAVG